MEHFIISLNMQSIPGTFLDLNFLIPCLISSRSKGLLSWSRLSLFLGFVFSLLDELQTVWMNCKQLQTVFPPVFNSFDKFQKLLGSVVCKVSSFKFSRSLFFQFYLFIIYQSPSIWYYVFLLPVFQCTISLYYYSI